MLRDSAIYILSRVVPSGLGFVTGMALTWLLTPHAFGLYGLGLTIVVLVAGIFFDWHGLSFMRFFQANAEDPRFMPTVVQTFLLLCLASLVIVPPVLLVGAAIFGAPDREYEWLIAISLPGCWAYAWFELAARVQVARFNPTRYFWMNLIRNILILAFGLGVAWAWHSAYPVLASSFLAMLVAGLLFRIPHLSLLPKRFDMEMARRLFVFGWAMALVRALGAASFAADRFLLEFMIGTDAVGFYTAAYQLAQTTIITIGAGIGSATYSLAVRAVESGDAAAVDRQLSRNSTLLLALLLPASVGAAMVSPTLAKLFVGPEYVGPVASMTAWMALAAFFFGFRANYLDHAFQLGHKTHRLLAVVALTAAVNLLLEILLIPGFGAVGVAIANLIAGAIGLMAAAWAARSVMAMPIAWRDAAKIAVAVLAMALFLWPFYGRDDLLSLVLAVIGGGAVYGAVLLALDAMNLRGVVKRRLARFA
ncbi:lipopolysaccharide biosynthesis protein [Dongia sp.]|uniref:lipopolysaccharide biosynthesis protein n=1 Tax=Dongia sp. TaxID=1977262 RepID=UPI00375394EC